MATSKATAQWNGTLKTGQGVMKPASAGEIPFTLGTRFEGKAGSNPEEVIGAALAGCFSMALSLALEEAGHTPRSIATTTAVHMGRENDAFMITSIDLDVVVDASGLDAHDLDEIAQTTKKRCPVGKALGGVPNIALAAKLK
ncbi:MAG TPA: OsmC family peroxiredoxin [Polyangiaceae bacterium]|jgi:osmotically inducible protein OsmC